ncbi:MAG: lysylphosphatidylglycerol synthase transmembrane domain-containing protein [Candidatus Omnitrophica bacterium]|nr:lysylphosphatidylglycerol synthase transmembrane domain-containing protein [Candidatus Omnitrophota bacterium]
MPVFKKIFNFALRIAISVVLIIFLFHFKDIDTRSLIKDIKSADKQLLLWAFLVSVLNYVLCFFRWEMLLKAANIHLPKKRLVTSFSGGIFFNLFLPSSIGGDIARSIDLGKYTQRPKEVTATVLLDRLSGYVGLAVLVLFSLAIGFDLVKNNPIVLITIAVIIMILLVILLVLFNKSVFSRITKLLDTPDAGRIKEMFVNLYQEIHYFQKHKGVLLRNLLLSLVIQAVGPMAFYITAVALGMNQLNPIYFLIFIPIVGAVTLLPISIGGFGLRESTSVILFSKAGIAQSPAAAMALLNSFFIFIIGIIGGFIYVLTIHHRRVQPVKSPGTHKLPQK